MRRQGGGFGFVILLVVVAIVFFLAMRNFSAVAPSALEVRKHNKTRDTGGRVGTESSDAGESSRAASADAWTPAPPSRPNLDTMDRNTSQHADNVKDALSQAN